MELVFAVAAITAAAFWPIVIILNLIDKWRKRK